MSDTVIKVENLSKYYRLGLIGGGTLREDLDRWIAKLRGKPDPLLKIDQVDHGNRKGDQIWALKDINFEVERGEILGIIGRNGAGKSTLLKVLSRITAPTAGRITIKGRVGSLLEVGTGFHPELTGRENIYLNGTILGMKKVEVESKLEEIVEFAEMAKFVDTPVKRYSSGMTVRLAFAVAAHLEPEILLVDEVLAVGDGAFQRKCIGKMQSVASHGRTVIFVSHNMASIRSLCSSSILLNSGKIESLGETSQIVSKYLSNSTEVVVDLAHRTDRTGNGEMTFQSLRCYDENGLEVNEIVSADYLRIVMTYKTTKQIDSKKFLLAVSFWDNDGTRVAGFFSDEMGMSWQSFGEEGQITLIIPSFLLRAGTYHIKLWSSSDLFENSTSKAIDVIERAATITVLPGDFWGSGKSNRSGSFSVLEGSFQSK